MSRENIQFETAILVSLVLHVAVLGGTTHSAALSRLPVVGAIVRALTPAPTPAAVLAVAKAETPREPVITFVEQPEPAIPAVPERPKQFVETDSSQVTGEKPKDTNFYSDHATVAANPDNSSKKTGDTPFLDGTETRILSTADVVPGRARPGVPLPPGPPQPPQPARPASPASPLTPMAPTAPSPRQDMAMLMPSKTPDTSPSLGSTTERTPPPSLGAPLASPTLLPEVKPPKPPEPVKPPELEKPEVKSPKENKGAKDGTEEKGALEKPKPLPDEGDAARKETKLAMLTPPPQPKVVPVPPTPPQPETPPSAPETEKMKPELSLKQPSPMPAPAPEPSPGSAGHPAVAGGGGGTGSAPTVGSEREIAARKSRLNTVGVDRRGVAAFNVADSPFGAYDKQVVRAVQSRWYALIQKNGLYERAGEVTIHFQLLPDGSVTNAEVKTTSAGEILALFCQKAVVESGPFSPWPDDLRAYLGNEPRDVDFTFYY